MTEHLPGTSRSSVVRLIVGVIAAVALMAAAFAAWYRFVLIPASIQQHRVIFAIQALKDELCFIIGHGGLPVPPSVGDILDHARARGSDSVHGMNGIDPWGTPYFFEVVSDRKFCGEDCLKVVVRSFGPNQRDDLGKADDIQTLGPAFLPLAERRNKPAAAARQP